jgi:predicted transcriptional regulator
MKNLKPPDIVINDLETLKVISDLQRLRIFQIVREVNQRGTPCSVKQISDELDIPPAKLYYHIRLLESHNLIQVAETHIVSGIVEKLYRVTVNHIVISDELLNADSKTAAPMVSGMVKEAMADISQNKIIEKDSDLVLRLSLRISPEKIAEFQKKAVDLLEELEAECRDEDAPSYDFMYIFYPKKKRGKDGA